MLMDFDVKLDASACPTCGARDLVEESALERVCVAGEDCFEVEVPVLRCRSCASAHTDHRAETLRHEAACRHRGVLTPEEIRDIRRALGMTRREFGEAFGIPSASLDRWENGRLIQNASLDTLLRALTNKATAARLDRRAANHAGVVLPGAFRHLCADPAALADARRRANGFHLRAVG